MDISGEEDFEWSLSEDIDYIMIFPYIWDIKKHSNEIINSQRHRNWTDFQWEAYNGKCDQDNWGGNWILVEDVVLKDSVHEVSLIVL